MKALLNIPKNINPSNGSPEEIVRKAMAVISQENRVSIVLLQRRLRLGYNCATAIIEYLESLDLVSTPNASIGGREITGNLEEYL